MSSTGLCKYNKKVWVNMTKIRGETHGTGSPGGGIGGQRPGDAQVLFRGN